MEEDPDARESLQWVQATILSFKSWVVPTALPLIPISDIHYSTFKILHQILGVEVTTIIIKYNSKNLNLIRIIRNNGIYNSVQRTSSRIRMTPVPSAAAGLAVFDTAELCELILKNLDFEDLLRARQVNQFLRDVVDGSKSLQQKLFRLPVATDVYYEEVNPLLSRILGPNRFKLWGTIKPMGRYSGLGSTILSIQQMHKIPSDWPKHVPDYFADMLVSSGSPRLSINLWRVWDAFLYNVPVPGPDVRIRDVLEVLERSRRQIIMSA